MITMTLISGRLSRAGAAKGSTPSDVAETTWNAVLYTAASGNAACCALARILVAAGCPDQPWEARSPTGQRSIHGDSTHALARTTVTADGRFVRWHPRPDLEAEQDAA